jgi:uncharacterized membrane protein
MPPMHRPLRITSIDLLRGVVMVLMALDHTRDFFSVGGLDVRNVHDPMLFLTRWITHFCAPVFVFLAGLSAFLYAAGGRTVHEVSLYLVTRGLWLVLLELTIVRFGWSFSLYPDVILLQVIWAIGVAMIVLAGLIHLPHWAIAAVGIAMILGHNLPDGILAEQLGQLAWVWNILHQRAVFHPAADVRLIVAYPLIPWIGVMAAGFAFGPVMLREPAERRRWLLASGIAVTLGFLLLRASNAYGDPAPWVWHTSVSATVLSFLNTEKYPPSALYLAMTLGPALLALAAFESARGKLAEVFVTFGRVPLFYYIAHLLLLHALAVVFALILEGNIAWLLGGLPMQRGVKPTGYGLDLPGVYLMWMLVVAALYLPCRWFAELKQRRKESWLRYI